MTDAYAADESMHEVAGIQKYATQVAQVADAVSKGDALTKRIIDAVHSGSSAAVERIFTEVGVDTRVSLSTVDASSAEPGSRVEAGGGALSDTQQGSVAEAQNQTAKTRTVTVTIGIGPISISVTVTKNSSK